MTKLASVIDVDHVLRVAQRRCEDHGVNVVFDYWATTAMSNGQTITLPAIRQPITQASLDKLYGYTIHECGHHTRSEAFDILNKAQPPDHVCAIFNILEDDGMERQVASTWAGDHKALSTMNSLLLDEVSRSWASAIAEHGDDKVSASPPEPLATMCIGQLSRLVWDTDADTVVDRLVKSMPATTKALLSALSDEGWVQRSRDTTTPMEVWDLTIDLVKRLYPNDDPNKYEDIREAGKNGKPGDRDKDGDPSLCGGSQGDEQGSEAKDEADNADEEGDGQVVSWKDVVLSEHNEWEPADGKPGHLGIDWTGYLDGDPTGVQLMPTNLVNVVDLAKADDVGYGKDKFMPSDEHARAFANRIRRYIQSKARSTIDRDKYHGKLDKGALVKLALPPIDGGDYNKRLFYDQRKHTMKDTAIFVLTDWSGSMSGKKMEYAADASQRLVYTFERILKVPVALAAFTNRKTECDIGYIKRFGTRGLSQDEIARRFAAFRSYTSANNDADALNWAYQQVLARKESRKLLIVLSDGCPAGSWGRSSGSRNLKYIANVIDHDKRVELYGVGICSDAVEDYYTNTRVLQNPAEINDTLFNIIKDGDNGR
jgi:cobalamin biosynthesis protein CobT